MGEDFASSEDTTLLQLIGALHVVYHENRSQILWFGQLVAHSPEILVYLTEDMVLCSDEMVSSLYSIKPVQHCM